jgi:methionyl-tRNA synthetase
MKGADEERRVAVVRTALEAVYAFTHFLAPVIPKAAQSIFAMLGTPPVPTFNLRDDFYNLTPGTVVSVGEILFQKLEAPEAKEVLPGAVATSE